MDWNRFSGPDGTDPVSDFRLNTPRFIAPTDGPEVLWSVLLDVRDVSLNTLAKDLFGAFGDEIPPIIIPNVYDNDRLAAVPARQVVTVFLSGAALQGLNADGQKFGVAGVQVGKPIPLDNLQSEAPPLAILPDIPVIEGTVVMAVIDDGIAIGHEVFGRADGGSRIDLAYVMHASPGEVPGQTLGRALRRSEINDLLTAHTYNGLLDEPAFYRATGIADFGDENFAPTGLRTSHGTHVMSLAAGFKPQVAPDTRPILCAMLPSDVTEDVSGEDLDPSLALALEVLLKEAMRYRLPDGEPAPVVINFSYGNFGGPHDGTSLIARLIETSLTNSNGQVRRAVLPAGNGNLSRTHAKVSFANETAAAQTLQLRALPDDRTASHVQIWLPYVAGAEKPTFIKVRVTPPNGPQSPPITATVGQAVRLLDDAGQELARLSYHFRPFPTARGEITLSLQPTARLEGEGGIAPSGVWEVEIAPTDITALQTVGVWVRRDAPLPGYRAQGRQAYFVNPCYERFDAFGAPLAVDPPGSDCPIQRAGLLSGFATGTLPIVVGGFTQSNGLMSDYSAAGPITPIRGARRPNRKGPDAAARSDDSPVLTGVIGAGRGSGSFVRQNGTSVAAPVMARHLADAIAEGHPADRAWVTAQASQSDMAFPRPKPAATRAGGGRMALPQPFGAAPIAP